MKLLKCKCKEPICPKWNVTKYLSNLINRHMIYPIQLCSIAVQKQFTNNNTGTITYNCSTVQSFFSKYTILVEASPTEWAYTLPSFCKLILLNAYHRPSITHFKAWTPVKMSYRGRQTSAHKRLHRTLISGNIVGYRKCCMHYAAFRRCQHHALLPQVIGASGSLHQALPGSCQPLGINTVGVRRSI